MYLHDCYVSDYMLLNRFTFSYETLEDVGQAIELYSQANNLCPTDPAILTKLADLFDAEGDKTQAFQCHYDVKTHLCIYTQLHIGLLSPMYIIYPGPLHYFKIYFRVSDISHQTSKPSNGWPHITSTRNSLIKRSTTLRRLQ